MRGFFTVRSRSVVALTTLAATSLLLAGCQRPVGSISGKITYQGKSLKGGGVSFVSDDGGQSFAAGIAEDGSYQIPNLKGGSYKVCVETASLKAGQQGGVYPAGAGGPKLPKGAKTGPPPDAPVPEGYTPSDPAAAALATGARRYVAIPEKYSKPDTTDLKYTFNGGSETFNIDLK